MKLIAIDTETFLIRDNNVPAPVCLTSYIMNDNGSLESFLSGFDAALYAWLVNIFSDENNIIIMQNAAFDLTVLCNIYPSLYQYVFSALEASRVHDTKIIEKIHKIAHGGDGSGVYDNGASKLSLAGLVYKYFDINIQATKKSPDAIRYNYGALRDTPVSQWSPEAIKYACEDAMFTLLVYTCQMTQIQPDEIKGHAFQVASDFALRLTGSQGICVDASKVLEVEKSLQGLVAEASKPLLACGFLDAYGKENKQAIQGALERAYASRNEATKKTTTGAISTDKQALEESQDANCLYLLEYRESSKLLSTYLDAVKMVEHPLMDRRLRCSYEVLQSTGRTSSREPNLQNLPRKEGIRDCFVPSPGHIFIACDYDAAELRTLAQCHYTMTGKASPLLTMYQKDSSFDPHTWFACKLMNITYADGMERKKAGDKEIKKNRQRAKACNFGFPGGMGAVSFQGYAKGYGLELTLDEANKLKNQWFDAWDMWDWLEQANIAVEQGFVMVPFSLRKRGHVSFTQACNTPFQGLASDGAKNALFNVSKECFSVSQSPLYDCRPVVFIHDEIILEAPIHKAQDAAKRLQEVMIDAMKAFCPDCPIEASPTLMKYWSKNAESSFDEETGFYSIWGDK